MLHGAVVLVLAAGGCANDGLGQTGNQPPDATVDAAVEKLDLVANPDIARSSRLAFAPPVMALGHGKGEPGTGDIVALLAADFTGDGKPDLLRVWYPPQNRTVQLAMNAGRGDGTVDVYHVVTTATTCALAPRDVTVADLDGDGRPDLLVGGCDMFAGVFYGNGDGTFRQPTLSAPIYSAVVGDFDGNGRPEVAGFVAVGVVRLARPQPDGSLVAASPDQALAGTPQGIFAGDFNGDGRADVVVTIPAAGGVPDRVQVLLGQANGRWTALPATATGSAAACIAAADFNRDGRLDLVLRDAVLPGRGDGSFGGAVPLPEAGYCSSGIADFDGDGNLDLVAAQGIDLTRAYVRLGRGDGQFEAMLALEAPPPQPMVYNYGVPRVTDWNADGKPDLVAFFGAFESDGAMTQLNVSK